MGHSLIVKLTALLSLLNIYGNIAHTSCKYAFMALSFQLDKGIFRNINAEQNFEIDSSFRARFLQRGKTVRPIATRLEHGSFY